MLLDTNVSLQAQDGYLPKTQSQTLLPWPSSDRGRFEGCIQAQNNPIAVCRWLSLTPAGSFELITAGTLHRLEACMGVFDDDVWAELDAL